MLLIRPASIADSRAVAELLVVLGYPASEDEIRERLPRLVSDTACAVVAERDGLVVGLATAHVFDAIHLTSQAAWLTALVVHPDAQRKGIGRALVHNGFGGPIRHSSPWTQPQASPWLEASTPQR